VLQTLTFEPAEHKYFIDGRSAANQSTILTDLKLTPPYKDNPHSMDFGDRAHKACELSLDDRLNREATNKDIMAYVRGFDEKATEIKLKPIATEMLVFNGHAFTAGRLDIFGTVFGGELAIVDLKTGQPPDCVELQTAGYEDMLRWMAANGYLDGRFSPEMIQRIKPEPFRRFSMHLLPERAILKECPDPYDIHAWRAAVTLWKWKFARRKAN
jgi:hypothetical protein